MGMSITCIILFGLISSLTCAPLEHTRSKRQIGLGSPGAPVIPSYLGQVAGNPPSGTNMFNSPTALNYLGGYASGLGMGLTGYNGGIGGVGPQGMAGFHGGLTLGLAGYGNMGAGLGIGGIGIGGLKAGYGNTQLNGAPMLGADMNAIGQPMGSNAFGMDVNGVSRNMGLTGMGNGMGVQGMGVGPAVGVAPVSGGLGVGAPVGGFGGYTPADFGIGALEVLGPYSIGGVFGPYGWNGLGGRAQQWGIEFGPWDYPALRLERFEDLLAMNKANALAANVAATTKKIVKRSSTKKSGASTKKTATTKK